MSIFGKKGPVELNRKEWDKLIRKSRSYKSLSGTIGESHANGTLEGLWNKFSSKDKITHPAGGEKEYVDTIGDFLNYEQKAVLRGSYFIGNVFVRAKTGNLHRTIANETMDPADYNARPDDSDLDKAARYIVNSSGSLAKSADTPGAPITTAAVRDALQSASLFDVRSETVLRDLHRRCVNQVGLKVSRAVDPQAPYPGAPGGAGYLLAKTCELARGLPVVPQGDERWFDIACFLFGAVIRSHGFTDGNGRVGRAAYAAAMLKGGLPFRPLKVSAEKDLHGLDHVS